MKVEMLDTVLHQGDRFEKEDIRTVSEEVGEYFCRGGVARDTSGVFPTSTPEKNDVILLVDNVVLASKVEKV